MTTIESEERAVAPRRWTVDRDETSVDFAVKTFWGLTTVRGRFDGLDGSYEVGDLEAAGRVVPLGFVATVKQVDDVLEVEATTTVDHRQLGLNSRYLPWSQMCVSSVKSGERVLEELHRFAARGVRVDTVEQKRQRLIDAQVGP